MRSRVLQHILLTVAVLILSAPFLCFPAAFAETAVVEIRTKEDLNAVRDNPSGHYRLMQDIAFETADFEEGGAFYNHGQGWKPIGYDAEHAFVGTFDGNGFTIRNLSVYAIQSYAGVFGYNKGTIRNLTVESSHVTASLDTYDPVYAGAIAGYNVGDVLNCRARSTVVKAVSTSMFNNGYAGGIVGYNAGGTVQDCHSNAAVTALTTGHTSYHDFFTGGIVGGLKGGTVNRCSNTGTLQSNYAGGIVGHVSNGTVTRCWNAAPIRLQDHATTFVGGIVGRVENGSVENCYNAGEIDVQTVQTAYVGGIVGSLANRSSVKTSYNLGELKATATSPTHTVEIGGVVGEAVDSTVSACYNMNVFVPTCEQGQARSAAQLRQQASFQGFSFSDVWQTGNAAYPYPQLRGVPMTASFSGRTDAATTVTDPPEEPTTLTQPSHSTSTTVTTTSTSAVIADAAEETAVPWLWITVAGCLCLGVLIAVLIVVLRLLKK